MQSVCVCVCLYMFFDCQYTYTLVECVNCARLGGRLTRDRGYFDVRVFFFFFFISLSDVGLASNVCMKLKYFRFCVNSFFSQCAKVIFQIKVFLEGMSLLKVRYTIPRNFK